MFGTKMDTEQKIHFLKNLLYNSVKRLNFEQNNIYSVKESISEHNLFLEITYNSNVIVSIIAENKNLKIIEEILEESILNLISGDLIYRAVTTTKGKITKIIGKW